MSNSKSANRKLAIEIHNLIDEPLDHHGDPALGYKIIYAITRAISSALKRGETVSVRGFGKFSVVDGKPRRTGNNIITQSGVRSPVPIDHAPKRYVVFKPSEQILAMLNRGTTWDEKRAMEIWSKE